MKHDKLSTFNNQTQYLNLASHVCIGSLVLGIDEIDGTSGPQIVRSQSRIRAIAAHGISLVVFGTVIVVIMDAIAFHNGVVVALVTIGRQGASCILVRIVVSFLVPERFFLGMRSALILLGVFLGCRSLLPFPGMPVFSLRVWRVLFLDRFHCGTFAFGVVENLQYPTPQIVPLGVRIVRGIKQLAYASLPL